MRNKNILFIIILTFFLRIILIGFGLPSKNLSLTTYNPDEPLTYQVMEKWEPSKFDFHPRRVFLWGGFHLYIMAPFFKILEWAGYLKNWDRKQYIKNLWAVDRLYIAGRFIVIFFSVLTVYFLYIAVKSIYGEKAGILSACFLAIVPVHVINSIYVRPDIIMLCFAVLSIIFSTRIIGSSDIKNYIFSSLFVGFATSTKLSGCVYLVIPVSAHFLKDRKFREKIFDIKLYLIPVIFLISFFISTPYALIDFNTSKESFFSYFKANVSLAGTPLNPGQAMICGWGMISYLKYYLSYGTGKIFLFSSILGFFVCVYNTIKRINLNFKYDFLFILSGFIIFLVISSTKNQAVWYTLPVIPFLVFYCVRLLIFLMELRDKINSKLLSNLPLILMVIIISFSLGYSFVSIRPYYVKNVREEASDWIIKHIPSGSSIGIPRSWYWTPSVLRQYNPPYKVYEGGDPVESRIPEAILGLKNIFDSVEYLVITEYEYRDYVHPVLKKYYPEHAKIIKELFYGNKFKIIAEFGKEKKVYLPFDWLIPDPRIVILKKNDKK